MKGAIWIHREIQDHQLWRDKPFSKGQAWIDMLLLANYKDNKIIHKNKMVIINRGEFVRSERFLAGRWGWSKSKVHDFLLLLESDEMIAKKSDQKANRISICNYNKYQIIETKKRPVTDQSPTSHRPVTDLNNNINNVNNVNNVKEEPLPKNSHPLNLSTLLLNLILERNKNFKQPNLNEWSTHIDRMIRIDRRDPKQIRDVIHWCQQDDFWQGNILSTKKLRIQFDQLWMKMNKGPKGQIKHEGIKQWLEISEEKIKEEENEPEE